MNCRHPYAAHLQNFVADNLPAVVDSKPPALRVAAIGAATAERFSRSWVCGEVNGPWRACEVPAVVVAIELLWVEARLQNQRAARDAAHHQILVPVRQGLPAPILSASVREHRHRGRLRVLRAARRKTWR